MSTPKEAPTLTPAPPTATPPTTSSAGDQLAFLSDRDGPAPDVYIVGLDGGEPRRLGFSWPSYVAWSPDGSRLAVADVERGPVYSLWVATAQSGSDRVLVASEQQQWIEHPAWSPDGEKIAYLTANPGERQLHVVSADGLTSFRVSECSYVLNFSWSPDGKHIAFDGCGGLNGLDVQAQRLVFRAFTAGVPRAFDPRWSPNGTQILFESFDPLKPAPNSRLYIMNADATAPRMLLDQIGHCGSWSPDGSLIAFHGQGVKQLWVVNADGTNPRVVVDLASFPSPGEIVRITTNGVLTCQPQWSPDGQRIAFQARVGGAMPDIFVVDIDGSDLRPVASHSQNDEQPAWRPSPAPDR